MGHKHKSINRAKGKKCLVLEREVFALWTQQTNWKVVLRQAHDLIKKFRKDAIETSQVDLHTGSIFPLAAESLIESVLKKKP